MRWHACRALAQACWSSGPVDQQRGQAILASQFWELKAALHSIDFRQGALFASAGRDHCPSDGLRGSDDAPMMLRQALRRIRRPRISFIQGLHSKACDCIRVERKPAFLGPLIPQGRSPSPCYAADACLIPGTTQFGRILVGQTRNARHSYDDCRA